MSSCTELQLKAASLAEMLHLVKAVCSSPLCMVEEQVSAQAMSGCLQEGAAPQELAQETILLQEVLLTAHMARAYEFPTVVSTPLHLPNSNLICILKSPWHAIRLGSMPMFCQMLADCHTFIV